MSSSTTRVLPCDPSTISFDSISGEPQFSPDTHTLDALQTAAHHLTHMLRPVAFPTETVYGLGALALNSSAASRIFSTKGRPADNPLIVHVSSMQMLKTLLPADYIIPETYHVLMKNMWPGALTLLFPSDSAKIPSIITAGQPTVAIRMPSHPVARALIAIVNAPLAAPSANSSGKPSPTRAEHVSRDLDGKLDIILDGGACEVGLESTVVDGLHEDGHIRILRPGGITVEQIRRALQEGMISSVPKVLVHSRDYKDEAMEHAPTTPGMKYTHYSPSVPVVLIFTDSAPPCGTGRMAVQTFLMSLKDYNPTLKRVIKVGVLFPSDSTLGQCALPQSAEWCRFPMGKTAEPASMAQRLFDGLLTLERQGVDLILIEEVNEENEGLAIMNRVKKAASETVWLEF